MKSRLFQSINYSFFLKAAFASFGAYFCMYAFRKPFTVALYSDLEFWGIDYKILLIIAQILGYTVSKFVGIKLISEMKPKNRIGYLIGLIVLAELFLLGFALTDSPYNILFMFLNGLPLGMIWGIVFSFIEGRKSSELLGVVLCSSFVVSSGMVKSVGKMTIDFWGVSEFWMPFVTGLLFIPPLIGFSYLLNRLPEPSPEDKVEKTKRIPLNGKERLKIFKQFAIPLVSFITFYLILTSLRDFRDNFSREIWDSVGYAERSDVYTITEIPIAILVFLILGITGSIVNNYKAFKIYHYLLLFGSLLIGISTYSFYSNTISAFLWMTLSGFGLYLCYVPFNGIFYDRMIATYQIKANVGFLVYISDAFGYLGSIGVLLFKNFLYQDISWLEFFVNAMYCLAGLGVFTTVLSYICFSQLYKKKKEYYELSV